VRWLLRASAITLAAALVVMPSLIIAPSLGATELDWDPARYGRSLPVRPSNLDFRDGLRAWGSTANGNHVPNSQYDVNADAEHALKGAPAARLESKVAEPQGYGVLRQDFDALGWRGKHLRFTAWLSTEDATEARAFVSFRRPGVEREDHYVPEPALHGTTPWTRFDVDVDVPQDAEVGMLGASLHGTGRVFATRFELKEAPAGKREK
jgi:erythromycin esterase